MHVQDCVVTSFGPTKHLCMATYGLSWPVQGTNQDQVLRDLVITSFGTYVMNTRTGVRVDALLIGSVKVE
jgi:hypothetical protein